MAHHTEQVGFPQLPLHPGMQIVLEALSPDTDAAVADVTSSRWSIYGSDESIGTGDPEDVIPHYVSDEVFQA